MEEEIQWNKLYKERTVVIHPPPIYEKRQLPDGVYLCPTCLGDGRVIRIHRMFGSHTYMKCYMCNGCGEIKKCPECNINPTPNDNKSLRCINCEEKLQTKLRTNFIRRCEAGELNDKM